MDRFDYQEQAMSELHERTKVALEHARDLGLNMDDLSLLCFQSGVNSRDVIKEMSDANQG